MGRGVARTIGASLVSQNGNEAAFRGERVVIKCARSGTSSIGVTRAMLSRLDAIYAGFEDAVGTLHLYRVSADAFRNGMYASRSGPADGRVQMISRAYAKTSGEKFRELKGDEVWAIGG